MKTHSDRLGTTDLQKCWEDSGNCRFMNRKIYLDEAQKGKWQNKKIKIEPTKLAYNI